MAEHHDDHPNPNIDVNFIACHGRLLQLPEQCMLVGYNCQLQWDSLCKSVAGGLSLVHALRLCMLCKMSYLCS